MDKDVGKALYAPRDTGIISSEKNSTDDKDNYPEKTRHSAGSDTFKKNKSLPTAGSIDESSLKNERNIGALGTQGLIKSFVGKKSFSGSWEENVDSTNSLYETTADMFQANSFEELKAIPVMFSEDALQYLSSQRANWQSYDEAISALRRWYSGLDKRSRIRIK